MEYVEGFKMPRTQKSPRQSQHNYIFRSFEMKTSSLLVTSTRDPLTLKPSTPTPESGDVTHTRGFRVGTVLITSLFQRPTTKTAASGLTPDLRAKQDKDAGRH